MNSVSAPNPPAIAVLFIVIFKVLLDGLNTPRLAGLKFDG
jgi:hypothetical protein